MKYEFQIGDYVETNIGNIGYISRINDLKDSYSFIVAWHDGGYAEYYCDDYIILKGYSYDYEKLFKRIGKYDFTQTTKTEKKNKIAPLEKNTKHGIFFYESENMGSKINEIINYINKSEDTNR